MEHERNVWIGKEDKGLFPSEMRERARKRVVDATELLNLSNPSSLSVVHICRERRPHLFLPRGETRNSFNTIKRRTQSRTLDSGGLPMLTMALIRWMEGERSETKDEPIADADCRKVNQF